MWEGDLVSKKVIFPRLDVLPLLVRVGTKTTRIKGPHRDVRRAVNHPARELARQTRAPANPNLRAATAPVVANTRRGTNQWIAIWRMGNSTVNIALNTQLGKDGHTI